MFQYRDRADIVARILETAQRGATKRRLMHKSFLSYDRVALYLQLLVDNDLLAEYGDSLGLYITTPRGMKFIEAYHEVSKLAGTMLC